MGLSCLGIQGSKKTSKEYIELEDLRVFLGKIRNDTSYKLTEEDKKLFSSFKRGQKLSTEHLALLNEKDTLNVTNKKKLRDLQDEISGILSKLNIEKDKSQIQSFARMLMGTEKPSGEVTKLLNAFDDKTKQVIIGVFKETLKTSLKKDTSYFGIGIREDTAKTIEKLKIVCEILVYKKGSTRNDELPKSIQKSLSLFEQSYTSLKDIDADIITINTQQYDSRGIKNSKLEETELDKEERKLLSRFEVDTDRAIVESLQEPIKKPNYVKHVVDNGVDVGLHFMEVGEEASTPKTIHEVSTLKQSIAQEKSKDISFSQMEGFELFEETAKSVKPILTPNQIKLTKAMEAWQPVINKAGSNNASFVFKPLEEEVLVKDLCRPDLNPSISITLAGMKFELIFPIAKDSRNNYIYSLDASSDDVIDAIIGLPDNNLFKAQAIKSPKLRIHSLNPKLRDYLLGLSEKDRIKVKKQLYSLIKLATHQTIGNYINDTLILSIAATEGREQDISSYFPKDPSYRKEIDVDNMLISYKDTKFFLYSPKLKALYVPKNLSDFSFYIGKKSSIDLPSILSNGLTITDIFYKDLKLETEIDLYTHRRALIMKPIQEDLATAEKKLTKVEKKISQVRSGEYAEDLRKKIASCTTDIKFFNEEIAAITAYFKSSNSVTDIKDYPTNPGLKKTQLLNLEKAKKERLAKGLAFEDELKQVENGEVLIILEASQKNYISHIAKCKLSIQAM